MHSTIVPILAAAAGLGLVHTLLGPDHYLPFVMLAKVRKWSLARTLVTTALCGVGHVGSSIALGFGGVALGYEVAHLMGIEEIRGEFAAWALVAFGAAYALWGVRRALRAHHGLVPHDHAGHVHLHRHGAVIHSHATDLQHATTFWSLFIVFVLGPCEPLIPLFVVPLSQGKPALGWLTGLVFSVATLGTMLAVTAVMYFGLQRLPTRAMERWSHALAGSVVAGCGLAVIFLGV